SDSEAAARSTSAADPTGFAAFLFTIGMRKGSAAATMGRDVIIFDTTLRDGEQAPGNSMTAEEKLRLAPQLDTLGLDVIEAGLPSASEGDRRAVRAIAEDVRRPVIAALARCHARAIDLAGAAVR